MSMVSRIHARKLNVLGFEREYGGWTIALLTIDNKSATPLVKGADNPNTTVMLSRRAKTRDKHTLAYQSKIVAVLASFATDGQQLFFRLDFTQLFSSQLTN
mmetsp:Transcript_11050/g.34118  ORF Transcript_11050/g.34118 Transcript_11050/m.34118 type:complete len:101 (+) Transcript_11050:115-417(+)